MGKIKMVVQRGQGVGGRGLGRASVGRARGLLDLYRILGDLYMYYS